MRGQHFLLIRKARDTNPVDLWSLTEADAYGVFCRFRWSSNAGEPLKAVIESAAAKMHSANVQDIERSLHAPKSDPD